jgi:hypothetical protein
LLPFADRYSSTSRAIVKHALKSSVCTILTNVARAMYRYRTIGLGRYAFEANMAVSRLRQSLDYERTLKSD